MERKTKELRKLSIYLHSLFPKNYFLPQQTKDEYIPENWDSNTFNVKGKYDNGNDLWIKDSNKEWIKAYHGTGRNCKNDYEIKDMINSILQNGFKNGINNLHADCDDIYHKEKKVGIWVYVTPDINVAKQYAGTITVGGKQYRTLFLVKVKKKAIRACNCRSNVDYWVVNGSRQEIRPVKVLYTEA